MDTFPWNIHIPDDDDDDDDDYGSNSDGGDVNVDVHVHDDGVDVSRKEMEQHFSATR